MPPRIQLTDKEESFISIMVRDACTPLEAAKRAGYADYSNDASRLMEKTQITKKIFEGWAAELCTWRGLIGQARKVLQAKMADTRKVSIQTECKTCGEITLHVEDRIIKDTVQVNAARTVLQTAKAFDSKSLADRADMEDKAENLKDAAERILGVAAPNPSEVEN